MAKGGGANRPRVRLLATVLLTAVILLVPTAVYAWGRSSSSFTVRHIGVTGTSVVPEREVVRLLRRAYLGRNLFAVTGKDVRVTLASLSFIARADVDRDFPDVLRVRVVEYEPALYAFARGHWYVIATDGRVVCEQPVAQKKAAAGGTDLAAGGSRVPVETASTTPAADEPAPGSTQARLLQTLEAGPQGATLGLPRMAVAGALKPGTTADDDGVHAALAALAGLPQHLRGDVRVAEVAGGTLLTLRFADGPVVVWGDSTRSQAKTLALGAVLDAYAQAGKRCTFADVSVPDRVLARPVLD